ncbi:unnamed protein product [Strongylus vulgaris]|uniref:Uncharacterized protein n=1 Tax=Strongylus vulgaris TaxID=40348 RepID=A0A3P7ILM5_STRVU|nr:unnamed protein product [Strongylus vulgaris]
MLFGRFGSSSSKTKHVDPLEAGGEKCPRLAPIRFDRDGLRRFLAFIGIPGNSNCSSIHEVRRHDVDLQMICIGRANGPTEVIGGCAEDAGKEQRRVRRRSIVRLISSVT